MKNEKIATQTRDFSVTSAGFVLRLLLLAVFSFPVSACAGQGGQSASYIAAADLPPQLLQPPPREGSPGWKNDIRGVLAAQAHISSADLAALRDEQNLRLELMTDLVGPDFTAAKYPKAFLLLRQSLHDASAVIETDKQYWHTRRPYLTDKHVRLLVRPVDSSPAYPSGHTAGSRVVAEILGVLYPERIEEFRARAASIARHRVQAGVHYPSDLEAGRMLAMLIVGALMKNDDFRDDLAAARAEVKGE